MFALPLMVRQADAKGVRSGSRRVIEYFIFGLRRESFGKLRVNDDCDRNSVVNNDRMIRRDLIVLVFILCRDHIPFSDFPNIVR